MLKNYLKTTWRFLTRHKSYSLVNIIGLAIGIASFIIIAFYVQYETSYNKFIENVDNKYRAVEIQTVPGLGDQHVAVTMGPLAQALKKDFPEVKDAARITLWGQNTVRVVERSFSENLFAFADSNIIDMMSVEILYGDKNKVLSNPNNVVLSEELAQKYFDNPANAIGNTIRVEEQPFKVTGVMKNRPRTSTFFFKALMSMEILLDRFEGLSTWSNNSLDTYIELKEGTDVQALEEKFPAFLESHLDEEQWEDGLKLYLQNMKDIHLKSNHIKFQVLNYSQGDINEIYVFSIIAFLILIVACINYINLSTARAINRAKEVGIRKVAGAVKSKLRIQFITESVIFALLATLIALIIVEFMLPSINQMLRSRLDVDFSNWILNIGLVIIILVTGVLSGSYPAFYLSAFQPVKVLKGGLQKAGKGSGLLRKILVIVQFIITIIIISSTLIAISQLNYFREKDKGYNDEHVYSVSFTNNDSLNSRRIELFMNEMNNNPAILSCAAASGNTGVAGSQGRMHVDDTAQTALMVRWGYFDENFLETMEIPVKIGRTFNPGHGTDEERGIILNEAAVRKLGWENPIGKEILNRSGDSLPNYKVIGVIKDYNYYSLLTPIEPAAYLYTPNYFAVVNLKLKAHNIDKTIKEIESSWNELLPGTPLNAGFIDENFEYLYGNQINTTKVFTLFSILCILISCLGLFGLISFIVTQRTKEVAVRKVFGSSIAQIIGLINRDFVKLILLAGVIAIPVAYYYMNNWLNNFPYRINISWYYFVISLAIALFIAIMTIFYHSFRTARLNPAHNLKYE